MAELGYTENILNLNSFKAECFAIISSKINELKARDQKKQQQDMKAKRRRR